MLCGIILKNSNDRSLISKYLKQTDKILGLKCFSTYFTERFGIGVDNSNNNVHSNSYIYISNDSNIIVAIYGDIIDLNILENKYRNTNNDDFSFVNPQIIYNLYISNNLHALQELEGVFTVVIINSLENSAILISDHYGMIPLYYYQDSRFFVFGTSIKCILTFSHIPRIFNEKILYEFLKLGFVIPNSTLFKNINISWPGEVMQYFGSLKRITIEKGNININKGGDISESANLYYQFLEDSIIKRIKSRQNCAILLSGGLDSAVIAGILKKKTDLNIKCYTIDLDFGNRSEIQRARKIVSHLDFEHFQITELNDNVFNNIVDVVWYNESPNYNGLVEWMLSKSVDKETEIVLTGDGNDLIWGLWGPFQDAKQKEIIKNFGSFYLNLRSNISDKLLNSIILKDVNKYSTTNKIKSIFINTDNLYNDLAKVDIKLYGNMAAFNLYGKVRMSPNPQTYRFPYLDHKLEHMVEELPLYMKKSINTNFQAKKYLFKYAIEKKKLFPHEIINLPKSWMYSPSANWLTGYLKQIVPDVLFRRKSFTREYFDIEGIKLLWRYQQNHQMDSSYLFMMLFTFEIWNEIFINNKKLESLHNSKKEIINWFL